jgi:predicted ATPase/DNA-binding NarL/FixJ family response regulator
MPARLQPAAANCGTVQGMSVSAVSPVFVGRRDEMAVLAGLLDRVRQGESAFAVVGGEAGVGKTRLVGELAAQAAAAQFTVLTGQCIELGAEGLPLAPLVDALRTLARTIPADELAGVLGPAGPSLARLLPELGPDLSGRAAADSMQAAQLLELVLGLLTRLSFIQPVMLILEDLHWADHSTLELVAFLARSLREVPVLLVVTYRSDELRRRHPLRSLLTNWERMRSVITVELRRFGRAEVAAQLAAILDTEPGPGLVDLVFDRSGGNAYLVEELAGVVRNGGDPAHLPPSLLDVLLSRVDSLSPDAQRLLVTAAVAGRRVPDRLLARVAGLGEAELFAALRESVQSHLLVVDHTGHGYEFRHALTRDAVYEDMLPGERVRLHAAYGDALVADPWLAGDDSAAPAALAHHWYAALDLPRALPASITAASHARASYAPAEALRHLERALEIWPRVPDAEERTGIDQAEVFRLAADAAYQAGAVDRALSLLNEGLAELPAGSDAVRRALLLDRRAHALRDSGREHEAFGSLEEALALLATGQVTRAHAVVQASMANAHMRVADMEAAAAMAERAVQAARAAQAQEVEADVTITLGSAQSYLGPPGTGLDALRSGLALALHAHAPVTALRGYVNLSDVLELLGRHTEAAVTASNGVDLAARIGLARTFGAYLTGNLAESWLRLGRWAGVDQLTEQALRTIPEGVFAATVLQVRAELAVATGRLTEASTELGQARQALGETSDIQFIQSMCYVEALIAHARGDLATGRQTIADGLARGTASWAARYSWPLLWLGLRIEADQAVQARDRRVPVPAESGQRARELAGLAADLATLTISARGYQALAAAEQARARGEDTPDLWSAATTVWQAAGEPYPVAYASLRLAEVHSAAGDRQPASAAAQQALAIARRLGAAPIEAEATALARRARLSLDDAPSVPDDELARFGLTGREREVLSLLAIGQSNPDIAQALFISPKTVSVHVSNLLAKLGVSGRVEAAALAHRLGVAGEPTS